MIVMASSSYWLSFMILLVRDRHVAYGGRASSDTVSRSCAFAGGFGAAKKSANNPKSKKKRSRMDMEGIIPAVTLEEPQQVLDMWGLPPPTEEDIFPLPLPETELLSATKEDYNLEEIKAAMKDYIPLNLDHFDENGMQHRTIDNQDPPMKLRLLHLSPPVLAIDNFLTPEECMMIQEVAMPSQDSLSSSGSSISADRRPFQVESKTFALAQSTRTSTSWFCYFSQVPILLAKAHYMLDIPLEQMEEPQIVRYRTGQEFSWHYDEVPSQHLSNGGQRIATLLVYLNTLNEGGGTIFRDLKDRHGNMLTMKPVQGSALLFFPATASGRPDDRTLHKGEVAQDEKRIIQMWTHERAYKPLLPPDNHQEDARASMDDVARQLGYL